MIQLDPGWLYGNDSDKVDVLDKCKRAIQLFEQKFNHRPDVVYINPVEHTGQMQVGRVRVLPLRQVQPNTFWVGVEPSTLWTFCKECQTRTDHEKRGDQIVCLECEKRGLGNQNAVCSNPS